jgi:hypothetical protein
MMVRQDVRDFEHLSLAYYLQTLRLTQSDRTHHNIARSATLEIWGRRGERKRTTVPSASHVMSRELPTPKPRARSTGVCYRLQTVQDSFSIVSAFQRYFSDISSPSTHVRIAGESHLVESDSQNELARLASMFQLFQFLSLS